MKKELFINFLQWWNDCLLDTTSFTTTGAKRLLQGSNAVQDENIVLTFCCFWPFAAILTV